MSTVADTKALYRARQTPEPVDVPEFAFLMCDGDGDPNVSPRLAQTAPFQWREGWEYPLRATSGS
jgi:hypothetical protein